MKWYNLAVVLLVPVVMIVLGWILMKKPPKDINGLYGYRTSMSMKNQNTWDFANRACGRVWFAAGWVMLPLAALAWTRTLPRPVDEASVLSDGITALEAVVLLLTIIPVELALSKRFDKSGNRK